MRFRRQQEPAPAPIRVLAVTSSQQLVISLMTMSDEWEVDAASNADPGDPSLRGADALVIDAKATGEGLHSVRRLRRAGVTAPAVVIGDIEVPEDDLPEASRVVTRPFSLEQLAASLTAAAAPRSPSGEGGGTAPDGDLPRQAPPSRWVDDPTPTPTETPVASAESLTTDTEDTIDLTEPEPQDIEVRPEPHEARASVGGIEPEAPTEPEVQAEESPPIEAIEEPASGPAKPEPPPESEPTPEPEPELEATAEGPAVEEPPEPQPDEPAPIKVIRPQQPPTPEPDTRSAVAAVIDRLKALRGGTADRPTAPSGEKHLPWRLRALVAALEDLEEMVGQIPALLNPADLAEALREEVEDAAEADIVAIWWPVGDAFRVLAHEGLTRAEATMRVPNTHPWFSHLVSTNEGMLIEPVDLVQGYVAGVAGARTNALMGVTLHTYGRIVGLITAGAKTFGPRHLERTMALAADAAPAFALASTLLELGIVPALAERLEARPAEMPLDDQPQTSQQQPQPPENGGSSATSEASDNEVSSPT